MGFARDTETPIERIGDAAQRSAATLSSMLSASSLLLYLRIFTLQRVEGRLFQPMAWTVAFALLGALIFFDP